MHYCALMRQPSMKIISQNFYQVLHYNGRPNSVLHLFLCRPGEWWSFRTNSANYCQRNLSNDGCGDSSSCCINGDKDPSHTNEQQELKSLMRLENEKQLKMINVLLRKLSQYKVENESLRAKNVELFNKLIVVNGQKISQTDKCIKSRTSDQQIIISKELLQQRPKLSTQEYAFPKRTTSTTTSGEATTHSVAYNEDLLQATSFPSYQQGTTLTSSLRSSSRQETELISSSIDWNIEGVDIEANTLSNTNMGNGCISNASTQLGCTGINGGDGEEGNRVVSLPAAGTDNHNNSFNRNCFYKAWQRCHPRTQKHC